jgi:hypothetical protein
LDRSTQSNYYLKLVAIAAIAILEAIAMISKVDGKYFGIAVAAIAGLAGFWIGRSKKRNG